MSGIDVFVGNYPVIDWDLYRLWVEGGLSHYIYIDFSSYFLLGYSEREALTALKDKLLSGSGSTGVQFELILSDLHDNYRLFNLWETMLHQPIMFSEQLVFQLDSETQNLLIEKYYALDDCVVRELIGRKFSSRLRKDLDETSERTRVSLRSCRRQFDNIKRVFRTTEEIPGNFVHNIKTNFLLPPALAEKYSVIVFIACHRFEINKKKLNYLSFEDFSIVCKTIMTDWTCSGVDVDENGDPSLDRDFFYSLRDLKCLIEKEKEHRYGVCQMLAKTNMKQRSLSEVEANFKNINKNMLWLGQTLYNNKEVKDLFVNVVDKVVEPLKQYKFTLEDLSQVIYHENSIQRV